MADTEVPDGTAQDVLDWVDEDPQRAQTALEAENCKDSPRSTLVTKLETIAAKEAPVSAETATTDQPEEVDEAQVDEAQAEQDELAPEQPTEASIYAEDKGTIISGVAVRDADVEVPDGADLNPPPPEPEEREGEEPEPISAEPVEFMQAASGTGGLVVSLNGTAYSMTAQQVAQLKQIVDKAVVGLAL